MKETRVLLIGESWFVKITELKGYDEFTYNKYEQGDAYLAAALNGDGIVYTHMPSHRVEYDFPKSAEELREKFDVVLISDCGANTFNLPMSAFERLQKSPSKLQIIADFTKMGGGFGMVGGYLSFMGIQARGAYINTVIEDVLPVEMFCGDDRVEAPDGITPVVVKAGHPAIKDMPAEGWQDVLGFNRFFPKDEGETLVKVGDDPFIVVGSYGEGRTLAYATDCGPHWSPVEFCEWDGYKKLWRGLVQWLAKAE